MEPFSNATVFIDVERASHRFLITQEMCQSLIEKDTTIAPAIHTFEPGSSQCPPPMINQSPMISQSMSSQMLAVSSEMPALTSEIPEVSTPVLSHSEANSVKSTTKKSSPEEAEDPGALAPIPRRFRCPECQRYTAESEEKMLRHIKKVHKGENPFQCYMCDYSTYNKSLFEEHVRIHQGIKPFKCSQCVYRSASKKNLKKHELIHRPNNPLKCKQCDFIARHPKALKRHEETHSQSDWLKFDSCKFQFQNLSAFKKHERTHKFKCKECDFKTCSRPFLKRHLNKEHGVVDDNVKRESFTCQVCNWTSSTMAKILLHLIHHPEQEVDESVIDITILRKHGIMA